MDKVQLNVRLTEDAHALLEALTEHYTQRQAETGRKTTRAEVVERAIRSLASREKISKKIAGD